MKIIAIILAAGTGSRMGHDTPKQFLKIGTKTIVEMSAEAFEKNPSVDSIYIVTAEHELSKMQDLLSDIKKIRAVVPGGDTRFDSAAAGLVAVAASGELSEVEESDGESDIVLVHDAARPFVSQSLIERVIETARRKSSAVPGLPVTDTIKHIADLTDTGSGISEDIVYTDTLDRDKLCAVQTPQGFKYSLLRKAYDAYGVNRDKDDKTATDDAMTVENLGEKVYFVLGEKNNRKITTREDFEHVARVGIGFDTHELAADRDLILGGVKIPHDKGLLGHSDADVLAHAIADAILGAVSLGDIGRHFPDSDPDFKDACSIRLMQEAARRAQIISVETALSDDPDHGSDDGSDKEEGDGSEPALGGYEIVNIDSTVMAEKPKLAPYIDEIRNCIAKALGIDIESVSVKATTTEGLGYVGREEGISAQAIVLLKEKII